MYIFPLVELLQVALNPNPIVSIGFQEEIIIDGKREEDVVLQIARRDMPKGAGFFLANTVKQDGFCYVLFEYGDDSTAVLRQFHGKNDDYTIYFAANHKAIRLW